MPRRRALAFGIPVVVVLLGAGAWLLLPGHGGVTEVEVVGRLPAGDEPTPSPVLLGREQPAGPYSRSPSVPRDANGSGRAGVAGSSTFHAEVTGRVLDAHAQPLQGIHVTVHREGGRRLELEPTDADGRYRGRTTEPGRYHARVRVDGMGTGDAGPLEVAEPGRHALPDILLGGSNHVSGRVVFPDGTPVDRVAVRAELDRSRGASWGPSSSPGFVGTQVDTGPRGAFRITGLRPGPLLVTCPYPGDGAAVVHCAGGTDGLRLVVHLRRLRVRIQDEHGLPLQDAQLGWRPVGADGRLEPRSRASLGRMGVHDEWPEVGERFVLAAHGPERTPREQEIVITGDRWSHEVTFRLERHGRERARVRLHLRAPGGRSIERFTAALCTPLARTLTDGLTDLCPDEEGVLEGLPPGRWDLVVYPERERLRRYAGYYAPVHHDLVLEPGVETRVELDCAQGGRLRIVERWDTEPPEDYEARVRVERPGAPHPLDRWLDPDDEDVTWILEPGLWSVRIYGEGVREERRRVEVEAGRTLDVEVVLRAD